MSDVKLYEVVLNAVKGLNNGKSQEFKSFVNDLSVKTMDETIFCTYINALRKAVPYMNKQHETLIGVVLKSDWASYELNTVANFIEFLGELVSAKTYYVKVCIRSLIKQFLQNTEVFEEQLNKLKIKCEHVHTALQTILRLTPLSVKYVGEIVKNCFPYTGKSLFVLETYVVHILQITVYAPGTRLEILEFIVAKLIAVDVHVPRHELEQESLNFEMEDELNFLPADDQKFSSNKNVCKLDQLMTILFAYIDSVSFDDDALDYAHAFLLFKDLIVIFESVVLKTQSSHVQFLLFYVASFHKDFSESFIEACWRILQDPNYASVLRQASSCYLSSFLARAKYVEKDVVIDQVRRLSEWTHRYIDLQDENSIRADRNKHGPFYSACQALFYIILYHYKSLLETPDGITFMKSVNLVRIVTSRLNPLKFCLESVVNLFARVTRMYQIVFCYSIIERNNRLSFQTNTAGSEELSKADEHDKSFFPFDPYMLPKSNKWVLPSYIKWNLSVLEEEEESDDDDDDNDISDEAINTSDVDFNDLTNKSMANSFDMMCISPGFQFQNVNGT